MAGACARSGRKSDSVELIVVTKNHPVDLVVELSDLGQNAFGENRDQEAFAKSQEFANIRPEASAKWHFVGQLQTNKVKNVLKYASTIHSLDRPSLLSELNKVLERIEGSVDAFIELNLTEDPARGGVLPEQLLELAQSVLESPRIRLLGLMSVAGLDVDPKIDFERTLKASISLQSIAPSANQLSMGMSQDFETAIEFGATHIRVGSAITGPRATSA